MIIEIKGVQFVNKGAELMLHAILEQLSIHLPDAEIAIPVTALSPYEARAKLGALQKFSIRFGVVELNWITKFLPVAFKRLSRRFGIVYECDIDIVLDASGFAYGDQWTDAAIIRMAKEVTRYKKNGAKYIFLPQAFGPFTKKRPRKTLQKHLPSAELILAREADSFKYLMDAVPNLTVVDMYPDFTNLLKGQKPKTLINDGSVIIIPNNNMVSVGNSNRSDSVESYENILLGLGEAAKCKGNNLYILNHEGVADQKICEALSEKLGRVEIINEKDPLAVKHILGGAKAVISSRFHGCVSALSQGTPCLGTSWSHKYEKLYQDYGVNEWLVTSENCNYELLIDSILSDEDARSRIENASVKLKDKSQEMWVKVFETINRA